MEIIFAIFALLLMLVVCGLVLAFYFLPSIVGLMTKKKNLMAIFLLNLLAGWTFIGWIIALVWACCKD